MERRFFFDLTGGQGTLYDEKGVEAADLDEAIEAARAVLEEMRDNEEAPAEHWTLIIRGEDGATLKTISLASGAVDQPTTPASPTQAADEAVPAANGRYERRGAL